MATHDFACLSCGKITEEWHSMRGDIPKESTCPDCGAKTERQISMPNFSTHGDDLNGGKPQYCPALARRMPYGKDDPKAYFSSKNAAREAARAKADTGDYQITFD